MGARLVSSSYLVTEEAIRVFAREFDPQLFHLDPEAAKESVFGALVASGWQTAAISMRLFVETMNVRGGIIGLGVKELKWPTPVKAGDELQLQIEVLDARRSKSRPNSGILQVENVTVNQRGEVVQSFTAGLMLPISG